MARKYMRLRDDNKMYRVSVYSRYLKFIEFASKFSFSFMHMHILFLSSIYVHVCRSIYIWRLQVDGTIFSETVSLIEPGAPGLSTLASHQSYFYLPALESQASTPCLPFYMNTRDPNSDVHACKASILNIEPSPQPLILFTIIKTL